MLYSTTIYRTPPHYPVPSGEYVGERGGITCSLWSDIGEGNRGREVMKDERVGRIREGSACRRRVNSWMCFSMVVFGVLLKLTHAFSALLCSISDVCPMLIV